MGNRPGYYQEWYAKNKERRRASNAAWFASLSDDKRARLRGLTREWIRTHPERVEAYNLKRKQRLAEARAARAPARAAAKIERALRTGTQQWLSKQMGVHFRDVPRQLVDAHVERKRVGRAIKQIQSEKEQGT